MLRINHRRSQPTTSVIEWIVNFAAPSLQLDPIVVTWRRNTTFFGPRRVYRWPPERRRRHRGGRSGGAGATGMSLDKGGVGGCGTQHIRPNGQSKRAERARWQWGGGIARERRTTGARWRRCRLWWGWGSSRRACCTTTNSARQGRACPCPRACTTWTGSQSWSSQGTGARTYYLCRAINHQVVVVVVDRDEDNGDGTCGGG